MLSAALVVAGLGVAHAGVITTTLDLASLPTGNFSTPAAVGLFVLTPVGGGSSLPTIVDNSGTYVLASSNSTGGGDDTYLTMNGGGTFTLVSVQIGLLSGSGPNGMNVSSTGYTDNLNNVATATPQTISFAPHFVNIASVDLDAAGTPYFTAITVSYGSVPEPSTLGVLGPALGWLGLAAAGRRRRVAGFGPPSGPLSRRTPAPG